LKRHKPVENRVSTFHRSREKAGACRTYGARAVRYLYRGPMLDSLTRKVGIRAASSQVEEGLGVS
jgi:hypothetical protein